MLANGVVLMASNYSWWLFSGRSTKRPASSTRTWTPRLTSSSEPSWTLMLKVSVPLDARSVCSAGFVYCVVFVVSVAFLHAPVYDLYPSFEHGDCKIPNFLPQEANRPGDGGQNQVALRRVLRPGHWPINFTQCTSNTQHPTSCEMNPF